MSIRELQVLIDEAPTGGIVSLPAGRYLGTLVIRRPVVVKGTADTILDGNGEWCALAVEHNEGEVRVEGVVLTGGHTRAGAGVQMANGGNLVLANVVIHGNHATGGGGGIYVREGRLTLLDTVIRDNQALSGGGLFATANAQVEAVGCRLENNRADEGGGALFRERASGTLKKVVFDGNWAAKSGGHLFLRGILGNSRPSLTLETCTFAALGKGSAGKAVDNAGTHPGTLELRGTTIPE